jgi:hypothetical protein
MKMNYSLNFSIASSQHILQHDNFLNSSNKDIICSFALFMIDYTV